MAQLYLPSFKYFIPFDLPVLLTLATAFTDVITCKLLSDKTTAYHSSHLLQTEGGMSGSDAFALGMTQWIQHAVMWVD